MSDFLLIKSPPKARRIREIVLHADRIGKSQNKAKDERKK